MPVELRKVIEQASALWQKLPQRRRWAVLAAAAATLLVVGGLALRGPAESWATLYAGLAPEDAGKVLETLKTQNVPFRLENGGATVEVPAGRVHELRILLASSGLPRGGGAGFELLDRQSFGTTSFVEQKNYQRALQGELARSIMALDAVERARVLVAAPERSLFRNQDEPPSASVVLQLRPGRTLSGAQVKAVVHLTASAIEGLRPERVTVVDESGALLWSGDELAQSADAAHELERRLARNVTDVVEPVVGRGRARVAVSAEFDHARIERTEDLYDKDKVAIRSETRLDERTGDAEAIAGGVAGARGNLAGTAQPAAKEASGGRMKLSETRNYEVNHVVNHTVNPRGRLKKLHVAVLVDGAVNAKGEPVARGEAELKRIAALATAAAGIDAERGDRIEVASVPFAAPIAPAPSAFVWPIPRRATFIGAGALAAIAALAAAVALVRRRRRTGNEAVVLPSLPIPVTRAEQALAEGSAPMLSLPERGARERALEAVRADAARAAKVLAAWLAESRADRATPTGGAA